MKRILVGVDGSKPSLRAVAVAAELAAKLDADLVLVNVALPTNATTDELQALAHSEGMAGGTMEALRTMGARLLSQARDQATAFGARTIATEIDEGDPAEQIVAFARNKDVDLIVVGSRGRGLLSSALLGSVSMKILGAATCPITIVH